MGTPVQRSIRLGPNNATSLDRSSGESGGIFYDQTNQTLRIFTGQVSGGTLLATRSWTAAQISQNLFSGSYLDLTDKPTIFSGDYADLSNKPTLFDGNYSSLTNKPALFNGDYNNLTNKPSIPSMPSLATVATSGSYTDLTNKPTIFSGSYVDLTNKPQGFSNLTSLSMSTGGTITKFSTDTTMAGNSNSNVPTENAVKTYVDTKVASVTGATTIAGLSDVQISGTPTTGYVLKWNGTKWAPAIDATSGGAGLDATTLNGQSGSYYLDYANLSGTPDLTSYAPKASPTFTGHPTIEGVTSTGATGTGKLVFDAGPTFTGHPTLEGVTSTGATGSGKLVFDNSPTFTGTVSGITAAMVGLGNVTNESKSTMFASPTFTGTVSGVTATHVGLGNVTNESKSTMFSSPTLTGTTTVGTIQFADSTTQTSANRWVPVYSGNITAGSPASSAAFTDGTIAYGQYSKIEIIGHFSMTSASAGSNYSPQLLVYDASNSAYSWRYNTITAGSGSINSASYDSPSYNIIYSSGSITYLNGWPTYRIRWTFHFPTTTWNTMLFEVESVATNAAQQIVRSSISGYYIPGVTLSGSSVIKPVFQPSGGSIYGSWEVFGMKK